MVLAVQLLRERSGKQTDPVLLRMTSHLQYFQKKKKNPQMNMTDFRLSPTEPPGPQAWQQCHGTSLAPSSPLAWAVQGMTTAFWWLPLPEVRQVTCITPGEVTNPPSPTTQYVTTSGHTVASQLVQRTGSP